MPINRSSLQRSVDLEAHRQSGCGEPGSDRRAWGTRIAARIHGVDEGAEGVGRRAAVDRHGGRTVDRIDRRCGAHRRRQQHRVECVVGEVARVQRLHLRAMNIDCIQIGGAEGIDEDHAGRSESVACSGHHRRHCAFQASPERRRDTNAQTTQTDRAGDSAASDHPVEQRDVGDAARHRAECGARRACRINCARGIERAGFVELSRRCGVAE
jgi:hypothetical protein